MKSRILFFTTITLVSIQVFMVGCDSKSSSKVNSVSESEDNFAIVDSLYHYRNSYIEAYGETHNLMHFSNYLGKEIKDSEVGANIQALFFNEILGHQQGWEGIKEDPLDYFIKDFDIGFNRLYPGSPFEKNITSLTIPYYLSSKGKSVHPLELRDLNGGEVSIENFRGKLLVLDFWATWCVPCLEQMPHMEKVKEHFKGDGDIVFISVSGDDKIDKWKNAIKKYNPQNELTTILPGGGKDPQLSLMDVSTFPVYQFIGKDGKYLSANGPKPESNTFSRIIEMGR